MTLHRPALVLLLAWPGLAAAETPMTAVDRQRVVAHLEMTEAWLESEVAGLSESQRAFRMSEESWTIKDVVEHLAIAEPQYWTQLQDSLSHPSGYTSEATDAGILWYGIDRTARTTTGEARVPKGQYASTADALAAFRKLRGTILAFARESDRDLRGRQLKGGNMSVYQWLLMISTHAQRHILQIREIKAHPSYPAR